MGYIVIVSVINCNELTLESNIKDCSCIAAALTLLSEDCCTMQGSKCCSPRCCFLLLGSALMSPKKLSLRTLKCVCLMIVRVKGRSAVIDTKIMYFKSYIF